MLIQDYKVNFMIFHEYDFSFLPLDHNFIASRSLQILSANRAAHVWLDPANKKIAENATGLKLHTRRPQLMACVKCWPLQASTLFCGSKNELASCCVQKVLAV